MDMDKTICLETGQQWPLLTNCYLLNMITSSYTVFYEQDWGGSGYKDRYRRWKTEMTEGGGDIEVGIED